MLQDEEDYLEYLEQAHLDVDPDGPKESQVAQCHAWETPQL